MPLHRICVSTYLERDERQWLQALADHFGVSVASMVRMLIHEEAERRGLKKPVLPIQSGERNPT